MGDRRWRTALFLTVCASAAWAVMKFGLLTWLPEENHPARNVLEGLSWVSAIIAVVPTALLAIGWAWRTNPPNDGERVTPVRVGPPIIGVVPALLVLLSGSPWWALAVFFLVEAAVFASGLLGALGQVLQERITDWTRRTITSGMVRFGAQYRAFMLRSLRTMVEEGPPTTGFLRPELDDVFVNVTLEYQAPQRVATGLVGGLDPDTLEEGHVLDDFLDKEQPEVLAVTGAPGSGKTTLLRKAARDICKSTRGKRKRRSVPLLLYLRDHAETIAANPEVPVFTLLHKQLKRAGLTASDSWFERRLKSGQCVVLLDGLDEVARQDDRRAVSAWVALQISVYYKNHFVITSRPDGYKSAKIENATVLAVQQFTDGQIEKFVHSWYRTIERRSSSDTSDLEHVVKTKASDLLERLNQNVNLRALTVNPLLLTMIVNVHRFRGALPGSRVDLYGEICEVMLWRRQEAKKLAVEMSGQKKAALLRGLAYRMMKNDAPSMSRVEVLAQIKPGMQRMSRDVTAEGFLADVTSNGLIVESENGLYAFAHLTFQEYLAAEHIRDKGLVKELANHVGSSWWRETTLLYAAKSDADAIVRACLDRGSTAALLLAFDCADQDSELAPELVDRMNAFLESAHEPGASSDQCLLAAGVLAGRHLGELVRTSTESYVCPSPITNRIYWLYQRGQQDHDAYRLSNVESGGEEAVLGVRLEDALAFTRWLNTVFTENKTFRLVEEDEVADHAITSARSTRRGATSDYSVWFRRKEQNAFGLLPPPGGEHPYHLRTEVLLERTKADVLDHAPDLVRLALLLAFRRAEQASLGLDLMQNRIKKAAESNTRLRQSDVDVKLSNRRRELSSGPRELTQNLEGERELITSLGLEPALDTILGVLNAIIQSPRASRVKHLQHGRRLAKELAGELSPEFTRTLTTAENGVRPDVSEQFTGRALKSIMNRALVGGAVREPWMTRLAEDLVLLAAGSDDFVVAPPDTLADRMDLTHTALVAFSQSEDVENFLPWALKASSALQDLAVPILRYEQPVDRGPASLIRFSALLLAAETGVERRGVLSKSFLEIAAGITLMEQHHEGTRKRNETIVLARA